MPNSRDPNKGHIAQWIKKQKINDIDSIARNAGKKRSEWVESVIDLGLHLAKHNISNDEILKLVEQKKQERYKKNDE